MAPCARAVALVPWIDSPTGPLQERTVKTSQRKTSTAARALALAFALLSLPTVTTVAQDETERRESGLVEEVKVRLQTLTIYATDADGYPVTDLEVDELVVKDGGETIPVAFLDPREPFGDAKVSARLFVDAPGGATRPVSTFRGEPLFYVFLIDLVHEPRLGLEEAKKALGEFVKYEFLGDELVAVLSFTGTLNLELPFTNDAEQLSAAVDRAYARDRVPADEPAQRMRRLMNRLDMCRRGEDAEGVWMCIAQVSDSYLTEGRHRALQYVRVLEGAVDFTAGLSGRKSLVVIGQGTSITPELEMNAAVSSVMLLPYTGVRDGEDYEFQQLINTAQKRNVVVHFVSRERSAPVQMGAQHEFGPGEFGFDPLMLAQQGANEAMAIISNDTGGSFVSDNNLTTGLQEIVTLERSGYVLGYHVEDAAKNKPNKTELRRVKVECLRDGVRIIAPRRYPAGPPPLQEINPKLTVLQPKEGEEEGMWLIPFQIQLDPKEIGYEVKKGVAKADFFLETSVLQADGRVVVRVYNFLNHEYDKKTWKSGKVEPFAIDAWVELPTGDYEVKVAVTNYEADRHGDATRRFKLAF
jgi:VWFA-related protein